MARVYHSHGRRNAADRELPGLGATFRPRRPNPPKSPADPALVDLVEGWGSAFLTPREVIRLAHRFCVAGARDPLSIEAAALFHRFEFWSGLGQWDERRGASDRACFLAGSPSAGLLERFGWWYEGREIIRLGASQTEIDPASVVEAEPTQLRLSDLL